ncbi:hypothetical protein HYS31_04770 [Candidatus Woesearchaeota archaeon]|nr:hypothetical protein [Candidatus Woesearchaeota archaeon]
MHPLTSRHVPKTSKEVIGQEGNIKQLKRFIVNFSNEKKNSCLIRHRKNMLCLCNSE